MEELEMSAHPTPTGLRADWSPILPEKRIDEMDPREFAEQVTKVLLEREAERMDRIDGRLAGIELSVAKIETRLGEVETRMVRHRDEHASLTRGAFAAMLAALMGLGVYVWHLVTGK